MVLSEIDRNLIDRCLEHSPRAWESFVDRFLGLVIHVVNHTAQSRSIRLREPDREDLAAEVFLAIVSNDYSVLRRFRGESSLATYLTVVARRVVVRELMKRKTTSQLSESSAAAATEDKNGATPEQRISDREEVERLLARLEGDEAKVVRLYHLENKSYREISAAVGMPENTVGPTLSRARAKMKRAAADTPAG